MGFASFRNRLRRASAAIGPAPKAAPNFVHSFGNLFVEGFFTGIVPDAEVLAAIDDLKHEQIHGLPTGRNSDGSLKKSALLKLGDMYDRAKAAHLAAGSEPANV